MTPVNCKHTAVTITQRCHAVTKFIKHDYSTHAAFSLDPTSVIFMSLSQ